MSSKLVRKEQRYIRVPNSTEIRRKRETPFVARVPEDDLEQTKRTHINKLLLKLTRELLKIVVLDESCLITTDITTLREKFSQVIKSIEKRKTYLSTKKEIKIQLEEELQKNILTKNYLLFSKHSLGERGNKSLKEYIIQQMKLENLQDQIEKILEWFNNQGKSKSGLLKKEKNLITKLEEQQKDIQEFMQYIKPSKHYQVKCSFDEAIKVARNSLDNRLLQQKKLYEDIEKKKIELEQLAIQTKDSQNQVLNKKNRISVLLKEQNQLTQCCNDMEIAIRTRKFQHTSLEKKIEALEDINKKDKEDIDAYENQP